MNSVGMNILFPNFICDGFWWNFLIKYVKFAPELEFIKGPWYIFKLYLSYSLKKHFFSFTTNNSSDDSSHYPSLSNYIQWVIRRRIIIRYDSREQFFLEISMTSLTVAQPRWSEKSLSRTIALHILFETLYLSKVTPSHAKLNNDAETRK